MANASEFTPLSAAGVFPTAIECLAMVDRCDDGEMCRALLELRICEVAGAIRDRHSWWDKVKSDGIVSRLRQEACPGIDEEETAVFNYALAEVRWQAATFQGPARPAAADITFVIDDLPSGLLQRLMSGAERIRSTSRRDVHPGSDGLVVDLVHPSMYAYEQGATPMLGDATVHEAPAWDTFVGSSAAQPEAPPGPVDAIMCSAAGLAWLPAEFAIAGDGKSCSINSYINSLHPHVHKAMYEAIGDLFVYVLPLFEETLNGVGNSRPSWEMPRRVSEYECSEHPNPGEVEESEWFVRVFPEIPASYTAPQLPPKAISLIGRHLQVIVKLASIELTPAQPKYEGGSWHVEGLKNERIVATTCVYLETENITESRIEFRTAIREPEYMQDDRDGIRDAYGLETEDPLVQPRGSSRTLAGRALAWPNTLQHRVRPFELADSSRPGRRTILCFFLVDPCLRVRSTATVPPQINEWIGMEADKVLPKTLPKEVRDQVGARSGGMSYEDACERRQRLMEERKQVIEASGQSAIQDSPSFFDRTFSLCEH